jgi:DNA-binding LacI/PurR family transcriptional regulator
MAARAVEVVAELHRHDDAQPHDRVELPTELIVRESTALGTTP